MLFLVKDTAKYAKYAAMGHEVISSNQEQRTATRLANDGHGHSYKELYDTAKGTCLILGMGPSRAKLPKGITVPVFGINRAAIDYPVDWWVAHDYTTLHVTDRVPKHIPLLTWGNHWLKPEFEAVRKSGRPLYFYDIYPDPTAHKKWPLYWNASTLGLTLDLATRMGFEKIYTLGTDLTVGGYTVDSGLVDQIDIEASHTMLRKKIVSMFHPEEVKKWNPRGVPILDISGVNMPCKHVTLEGALPDLCGSAHGM